MSLWSIYPPAAYYLGFFAAITIEADNVEIDLNGFEIRQSKEFYLVQRFFNVIELNNRPFVPNEGVSSLNYQKTDRPAAGDPAGSFVMPQNVIISNGSLGLSSHSGIHGNGVVGLTIHDVTIKDFEVSGIHCNGCKEVDISDCTVGPSSQQVPALATFSNARFLQFFTKRLIPGGFHSEPQGEELLALFDETITFADRPDQPFTLQQVFDKTDAAVELFRRFYRNEDLSALPAEDKELLEEAKNVFGNKQMLPDGSVLYGILMNRLGLPTKDDVFNGAGVETETVRISRVTIKDLRASPVEVPSLMTDEGAPHAGSCAGLAAYRVSINGAKEQSRDPFLHIPLTRTCSDVCTGIHHLVTLLRIDF